MKRSTNIAVALGLTALAAIAVWLVFFQGNSGDTEGADSAGGDAGALVLSDTSLETVAEEVGFVFPESTEEFLTAQPDSRSQMDLTFTMDPADAEAFLEGSGFPPAVEGQRLILHSSPLWELNPDSEVSSATDTHEGIARTVEFTEEEGRTRVRIVLVKAPDTELPADTGPEDTGPADTRPEDTEPADTRPEDTEPGG